jgi:hypothetical protein
VLGTWPYIEELRSDLGEAAPHWRPKPRASEGHRDVMGARGYLRDLCRLPPKQAILAQSLIRADPFITPPSRSVYSRWGGAARFCDNCVVIHTLTIPVRVTRESPAGTGDRPSLEGGSAKRSFPWLAA